jgi:small subunit ribosomal protein S17e
MGRIKTVAIKSLGNELIKEHGSKFSADFEKNKEALNEVKEIKSKRVRNILAGYITRKMQSIKKSGI